MANPNIRNDYVIFEWSKKPFLLIYLLIRRNRQYAIFLWKQTKVILAVCLIFREGIRHVRISILATLWPCAQLWDTCCSLLWSGLQQWTVVGKPSRQLATWETKSLMSWILNTFFLFLLKRHREVSFVLSYQI